MRLAMMLTSLTLLSASSAGCGQGQANPAAANDDRLSGSIQLAGSSTIAPLAIELAKRFEGLYPQARVDVQTGGSSRGIADARKGAVDLGMSSRALKDSEKEGLEQWEIAFDGVCFLVHRDNPVRELTREQLKGIYCGEITHWNQVGGNDAEIICINRADGRSELELVTKLWGIKPMDIEADLIAGENQQGIKMVATDPNAITYMSVGASEFEANAGTPIALLPLDGIAASVENVANGSFPLSRPLIFVTKPAVSKLAETFISFARSKDVHDLVEEFSYVPIKD